jgi:ectoine hydroxylase-related dioxygenase (phytanoyl-CoA dioxygenase family)
VLYFDRVMFNTAFDPEKIETMSTATLESLRAQLDAPYVLSSGNIEHFRGKGYVKLKQVLSPEALEYYGQEITSQVLRLNNQTKPMSERNTYQKAFLQIMNLWTKSDIVREFSFSKRLARIAAELMGVKGVRMYHDQALYKEPSGGLTPWHADQYYWPLSSANTCTVWVPLQKTPRDMGPLAFSECSHTVEHGRELPISDESEVKLQQALDAQGFKYEDGPFDLGEVSYHYGWTFHRAGPNTSQLPRGVMTVIYMEDGIKLTQPLNKNHQADWDCWLPGCKVGEPCASKLNPVLYQG